MNDIQTRADIDVIMAVFYERAFADDIIGYIFTEVAHLDLESHLPIIGDFWESLLSGTGVYSKHGRNPILVHRALHLKSKLSVEHFERWLQIFQTSVDEAFGGEKAELIKTRAHAIAKRFMEFLEIQDGTVSIPVGIASERRQHPG